MKHSFAKSENTDQHTDDQDTSGQICAGQIFVLCLKIKSVLFHYGLSRFEVRVPGCLGTQPGESPVFAQTTGPCTNMEYAKSLNLQRR